MGLNLRRVHTLYQAENYQATAFQDGTLYTLDGKAVPHDPDLIDQRRIFVPDHLKKFFMMPKSEASAETAFLDFMDLMIPEEGAAPPEFTTRTTESRGIHWQETIRKRA